MRIISLLCAAILSAGLALAQASKPVSAFEEQLIDLQKQFLQAVQSKNSAAVEGAIADDFMGVETNGDLYDRSEIVESVHEGLPKDTRTYDFYVVTYNLIVPGEHPRYRHMADTWAKVAGRWKLKFRQFTPNLWTVNDPN
jgi:hypothetical protein